MLRIDFGLHWPPMHVCTDSQLLAGRLYSPILRHLRSNMSIGGDLNTYGLLRYRPTGSRTRGWPWRPAGQGSAEPLRPDGRMALAAPALWSEGFEGF